MDSILQVLYKESLFLPYRSKNSIYIEPYPVHLYARNRFVFVKLFLDKVLNRWSLRLIKPIN